MIVRISIFDTIINLYKPYIMDNCIKIVSKIHFLTFGDGVKINKELNLCDLALYLSCLGRIRTLTGGTRIRRATITPQGRVSLRFACAKLWDFFYLCKFFRFFLRRSYEKSEKMRERGVIGGGYGSDVGDGIICARRLG